MRAVFHHSNNGPDLHEKVLAHAANLLDDESIDFGDVALVTNSRGLLGHGPTKK